MRHQQRPAQPSQLRHGSSGYTGSRSDSSPAEPPGFIFGCGASFILELAICSRLEEQPDHLSCAIPLRSSPDTTSPEQSSRCDWKRSRSPAALCGSSFPTSTPCAAHLEMAVCDGLVQRCPARCPTPVDLRPHLQQHSHLSPPPSSPLRNRSCCPRKHAQDRKNGG